MYSYLRFLLSSLFVPEVANANGIIAKMRSIAFKSKKYGFKLVKNIFLSSKHV